MDDARIYQSADSGWIVFDGKQKHFYGADEISARQHYARLIHMSAIGTFQTRLGRIEPTIESLISEIKYLSTFTLANQLNELVEGTAPGTIVDDSTLSREAAILYLSLIHEFHSWLTTQNVNLNGMTPEMVFLLR